MRTVFVRQLRYVFGLFALTVIFSSLLRAGSLNPPGPLSVSTTGYTLSDIYVRIASGTAAPISYSLFPAANPGSTGFTLGQIYNALPGGTETSAATGDVVSGKTFIARTNGVMTFMTGKRTGHELPASGQSTVFRSYDDAYIESQSIGFSSAARTMNYTMYNYIDGNLVETSDVNQSSVTVDNLTGLMWITDGNMSGETTWANALTWCQNLDYAGFTDWRLPNCRELCSIVNYEVCNPAIDITHFRNISTDESYWTSTTAYEDNNQAWIVSFWVGGVSMFYKTNDDYYAIRAVRGGP